MIQADLDINALNVTLAEKLAGEVDSIHDRIDELARREADHAGDYREFIPRWNNVWHRLERAMVDARDLSRRKGDVFDVAWERLWETLRSLVDGFGESELDGLAARIREAEGLGEDGL